MMIFCLFLADFDDFLLVPFSWPVLVEVFVLLDVSVFDVVVDIPLDSSLIDDMLVSEVTILRLLRFLNILTFFCLFPQNHYSP